MATATDTPLDVEITLIDIGPCAKQIKFNIPAKSIDTRLSDALSALAGEAAVPGFRKGKAPRGLIEKKFGANLLNEARGQIMSDAYQRALDENKLRPISEPRPVTGEVVADLQRGKSFTFSVEIEIAPEFAVPDFTSYEVKKPTIDVTQEHIDGEILRQSYRWGAPARLEGTLEHLDRMLGKAVVTIAGKDGVFFETDKALCVVPAKEDEGKGALLGLIFDGLDKALLGKSVGDEAVVAGAEVEIVGIR